MSDGVNKLKELLFDTEARRLDEVNRRLVLLAETETQRHGELSRRVDAVFERAGTVERMQKSVAGVIDGALRDAEIDRHDSLSKAVAPLVVSTIKYELKNSQDEMVDALYPITGRLVKQYVTAAVNEKMLKANEELARKMPGARLAMRIKSMFSRVSPAEQLLAASQRLEVEELFLVRRGTGELVAHWDRAVPAQSTQTAAQTGVQTGKSNRGALVPSYLSAITSFAEEAFDADKASLRTLDMGDSRIFLRSSPAYLLAAKCSGRSKVTVEQVVDDEFLRLLEKHHDAFYADATSTTDAVARDKAAAAAVKALPALARDLDNKIGAAEVAATTAAKIDFTPLYMLAALILIPLLSALGWYSWQSYLTQKTEVAAQNVLAAMPELNGFPVQVLVDRGGRALTVSGLAPSNPVREVLVGRLAGATAERVAVRDRLGVLPAGTAIAPPVDLGPLVSSIQRVETDAALAPVRRAIARADIRVGETLLHVERLLPGAGAAERERLDRGRILLRNAATEIATIKQQLNGRVASGELNPPLTRLQADLSGAEDEIGALAGRIVAASRPSNAVVTDPAVPAEDAAFAAERLASMLVALERTAPVKPIEQRVGVLSDKIDAIRFPAPDARQRLEAWTRANAVFFANGTDFGDDAKVGAALDQLVALMRQSDTLVRVVGYTDERGGANINTGLALSRADKVVAALVSRGATREKLVAVGRSNGNDLTPVVGPNSANRRVEFETGFIGETGSSR